jgi:hypothetical protein
MISGAFIVSLRCFRLNDIVWVGGRFLSVLGA